MNKHTATVIRTISQIFFFFLSPGLFASAFGGAKSIATTMGKGEILGMSAHILTLILLLSYTLLFGRIFCGYACAFGALGDGIYALSRKLFYRSKSKKSLVKFPRQLQLVKYGVLLAILTACICGNQQIMHGKSPWDAFAQLVSGQLRLPEYLPGFVLLALILVGMGLTPRFFCRFLCPLGALFSLLPPALLAKLKKPPEKNDQYKACGKCRLCSKTCPAELELAGEDVITSGECFSCHRCVDACYQNKPSLSMPGSPLGTYKTIALLAILLAVLVYLLGL